MSSKTLSQLYLAAARGGLDSVFDEHPELVSPDVLGWLDQDIEQAMDAGDVRSAKLGMLTASLLRTRLGDRTGSLRLLVDILLLRTDLPEPGEDIQRIRDDALRLGSKALDEGWRLGVAFCLVVAVQCSHTGSIRTRPPMAQEHLGQALRDLADAVELIAEYNLGEQSRPLLIRAVGILGWVVRDAQVVNWPGDQRLAVTALLRRIARAAERSVPRQILTQVHADRERVQELEAVLMSLFRRYG